MIELYTLGRLRRSSVLERYPNGLNWLGDSRIG